MSDNEKTERIASLNDEFRKHIRPGSHVYLTNGVAAFSPADQSEILRLVKTFEDFSKGNNPYGERDFGAFQYNGEKMFWKIDYYDADLEYGSEDPADPEKTTRVITIMLSKEY